MPPVSCLTCGRGKNPWGNSSLCADLVGGHGGQLLPGQARRQFDPDPLLDGLAATGHHHASGGPVDQVIACLKQGPLALHHLGLGRDVALRTVAKSCSTTGMYVGPLGGGSGGGAWAAPRPHSSSPTHSPPTPARPNVVVRRVMADPPCSFWLTDPPPSRAETPEAFCKRRPPRRHMATAHLLRAMARVAVTLAAQVVEGKPRCARRGRVW